MLYRCNDCGFPFDTDKCEAGKNYHVEKCVLCKGSMMRVDNVNIDLPDFMKGLFK